MTTMTHASLNQKLAELTGDEPLFAPLEVFRTGRDGAGVDVRVSCRRALVRDYLDGCITGDSTFELAGEFVLAHAHRSFGKSDPFWVAVDLFLDSRGV